MSSPPRPSSPLHPTRQQLDDLDQLMQRMLALPVDEEIGAEEPNPLEGDSGPLLVEDVVVRQERAAPRESPSSDRWAGLELPQTDSSSLPVPGPTREAPAKEPGPGQGSFPALILPPLVAGSAPAIVTVNGAENQAKTSEGFPPLVWVNDAFDVVTVLLGPLGRGLREPKGRSMLGWLGWAFLAAAVAWGILDWLGLDPLTWVR